MVQNKGLYFKQPPTGWPEPGKHIAIEGVDFDESQEPPQEGITAKIHYVSFDPYQRGRMRGPDVKSYAPPFELNKPITNSAIVKVLKSATPKFQPGNILVARQAPTSEYAVFSKAMLQGAEVLQNSYGLDEKLFLGALGMPGLTAYSSYYEIGAPKKGETIFISAASGAVGQIVGQLAKHDGLKVVGSVGDDKKLEFIKNELKFDGGFNYKKEKPLEALQRLAPDGIDIYYENVGGEQLDAALQHMNPFGRIIACGMISQYNKQPSEAYGVKSLMNVVGKRIKMQGFIVSDPNMGPKYSADHQKNLQRWIHEGTFKTAESVTHGIDNAAEGFLQVFEGKNFGKAVLEVAPLTK